MLRISESYRFAIITHQQKKIKMKECEICKTEFEPFREFDPGSSERGTIELCPDCFPVFSRIAEYFRENEGCYTCPCLLEKGEWDIEEGKINYSHLLCSSAYPDEQNHVFEIAPMLYHYIIGSIESISKLELEFEDSLTLLKPGKLEKLHYLL